MSAAGVAVALTASMGASVSHAAEGSTLGVPTGSISADGKFFAPGPNTVVKRTEAPAGNSPLSAESASPVAPAPAGTAAYYNIKNAHWIAQSCGTNMIQQTSGQGKTTLVLSVEKSVAATVTKEVNVDLKYVSAGMGWSVTSTYGVKNESRFEVPDGKWGTVQAFPLFDVYEGEAWAGVGGDLPTGKRVWAYKPVGVCFNQWAQ
ncbi:hypothetical protein BGK67_32585 [Streptomyces subrutilus]|uniref:Uncharacterized protein n=2 Tax=Streptomyces subrutilus TaxID=36818 RepID=A0A1E5P0P1_9ACTN|nr:hypothetical protein BGK67_32585 [Streptomyces subrutilus]